MFLLRRKDGQLVPVEQGDALGTKMPESQAERDEVYERIGQEVEALGRAHEQVGPCADQRPHPSFRGRPPRK